MFRVILFCILAAYPAITYACSDPVGFIESVQSEARAGISDPSTPQRILDKHVDLERLASYTYGPFLWRDAPKAKKDHYKNKIENFLTGPLANLMRRNSDKVVVVNPDFKKKKGYFEVSGETRPEMKKILWRVSDAGKCKFVDMGFFGVLLSQRLKQEFNRSDR